MSRRRALLAGAVAALAGFCICAPALAASAPVTQLTNPDCHTALLPTSRRIAVTSVMRPVNGTVGMEMMFELERSKRRAGPFRVVLGHGLEAWVHPNDPTLGQRPGDVWEFNQKVEDLSGPAYYRFRVRFRWIGSRHRVLATSAQTGPDCYQPELRPDLFVRSLTVSPVAGSQTQDQYVAVVGNHGLTGAGPVELELITSSSSPQSTSVPYLRPHSAARVSISGPACTPGRPVTVIVDPKRSAPEADWTNNTLTEQCP